jgi:hypothetical protein
VISAWACRPRCLSDLSRRDRTIVARQFIAWTMYKGRRVPEGRMIRGEREIALPALRAFPILTTYAAVYGTLVR